MDRLSKDRPFIINDTQVKTNLTHEHSQLFLTFLNNILIIMNIFMTDRQIESLAKDLWINFVQNYVPRSSKGYIITGKRILDAIHTFFFCERTFGDPADRIAEWKNRIQVFSIECSDTIFGELFSQAVLNHIRVHRHPEDAPDSSKMEVEWFKMNNLSWEQITLFLVEVCTFVQAIKNTKPITVIDINSASLIELKTLPLVGPKLAKYIVDERTKSPFTGFKDLKRVHKLGDRIINAFREFVKFNEANGVIDENAPPNINTASALVLQELPKIGPIIAERIVNYRKKYPFISKEGLLNVQGIGPKTFTAIKNCVAI